MQTDRYEIGSHWLSKRDNSPVWCRTWFDKDARQTRRASLGTESLEEAKIRLAEWVTLNVTLRQEEPRDVPLATVCMRYFEKHGRDIVGSGTQRRNLELLLERIPEFSVAEFTLEKQQQFVRVMKADGYQNGTTKRVLGAAKAAVNWAWKNGLIKSPIPFLSVQDGQPRERVMTIREMASLWDAAESDHLRAFLALLIGTASRPEALLELTRPQCDLHRKLIDLNPPGRQQTKKRRPVVAMPEFLRPLIESVPAGHIVTYRGEPLQKINACWRNARKAARLSNDIVPTTIRHTIATELRSRGVAELEIAGLLGHVMPNIRTTGRYAKYAPDYLSQARQAIDDIACEIERVAARSIRENLIVRAICVPVQDRRLVKNR